jgi:hypothetical protein
MSLRRYCLSKFDNCFLSYRLHQPTLSESVYYRLSPAQYGLQQYQRILLETGQCHGKCIEHCHNCANQSCRGQDLGFGLPLGFAGGK